jgi:hypothetical protein
MSEKVEIKVVNKEKNISMTFIVNKEDFLGAILKALTDDAYITNWILGQAYEIQVKIYKSE